ncbi:hypothetical protein ACU4GD_14280 [Cupriavidus basilensis]
MKRRTNTVAMWDNLQVQHYAVADYGNAPRKMLRATLAGTLAGLRAHSFAGISRAPTRQGHAGGLGTLASFRPLLHQWRQTCLRTGRHLTPSMANRYRGYQFAPAGRKRPAEVLQA